MSGGVSPSHRAPVNVISLHRGTVAMENIKVSNMRHAVSISINTFLLHGWWLVALLMIRSNNTRTLFRAVVDDSHRTFRHS